MENANADERKHQQQAHRVTSSAVACRVARRKPFTTVIFQVPGLLSFQLLPALCGSHTV
jgi:hypothetical protein